MGSMGDQKGPWPRLFVGQLKVTAEGYVLKYADKLDESVNWTENKDLDGYRAVRMVNDIKLNDDALKEIASFIVHHDAYYATLLQQQIFSDSLFTKVLPAIG
ncbi:hypothetical protein Tco_0333070 [Tanacetum coccineum]